MADVRRVLIEPEGQTEIDWHDTEFQKWGI